MGGKRISSLFDGFVSGFILGMAIAYLALAYLLEEPMPTNFVMAVLIGTVIGVAILAYSVHSALTTKEP